MTKRDAGAVESLLAVIRLGRPHLRSFAIVAVLVSLGTLASLAEPWIYRAIVDDIAGVFVTPPAVRRLESRVEQIESWPSHLQRGGRRILSHRPLRPVTPEEGGPRRLPRRSAREAVATVVVGAFALLGLRLVSEWFTLLGDNRVAAVSNRIESGYILGTFRHVLSLPLDFFTRRPSGAVARQIDQSDHVAPLFQSFALDVWPNLFRLLAILGILATLNHELSLVALLAVPAYAFVSWRMARRLETRLEEYYGLWDEVSGRIQEALAGIRTVLAVGASRHEHERLAASNERALAAYVERNRLQNRYGFLQESIATVTKTATLLLGGLKALEHQLTPGDVVMFVTYLDQLYYPVQNLTELYTSLQEHGSSLQRSEKLRALPPAPGADRADLRPGGGEIVFEDVRFTYRPGRPVLDGVSLRIAAGERVAIVGPSGAGKTTLADLLVGLFAPQAGRILVDGQDVSRVSPASLRAAIRGVAVDGTLFRMTLAENIRYGTFDAGDDDVRRAASEAGLDALLARLPEGLETPVGERGAELSAGERQRVLLARVFVSRPRVLVLDEATANLDFRTEQSVQATLRVLAKGRTTIVIAHRRSMLADADRVLVLRHGRIEQDGPPAVLESQEGWYRDLVRSDRHGGA